MLGTPYDDILQQAGFELIGRMDFRLHLTVWWNPAPEKLLQVVVLSIGSFRFGKKTFDPVGPG